MKKYICYGGYVRSGDGDVHWVSGRDIRRLYGVPPIDTIIIDTHARKVKVKRGFRPDVWNSFTRLYPDQTGEYNLEKLLTSIDKPHNRRTVVRVKDQVKG